MLTAFGARARRSECRSRYTDKTELPEAVAANDSEGRARAHGRYLQLDK